MPRFAGSTASAAGRQARPPGLRTRAPAARPWATVVLLALGLTACANSAPTPHGSAVAAPRRPSAPSTTATRRAGPTSLPTTTVGRSGRWAVRTIESTGTVEDLAVTTDALYWLSLSDQNPAQTQTVTPVRDDLATGQVTTGTPFPGVPGDLTVTGGWVWLVVGVGTQALVEQLSPTTLDQVDLVDLSPVPATVGAAPPPYQGGPVLAATVHGPLWVTYDESLWALNPSTGAVEAMLHAGDEIVSMSTDPSGTLLYTSGGDPSGGMSVTEYDARTGVQRESSLESHAVGPGTVAGTVGGVWISFRSGMAGTAGELADSGLDPIAPPAPQAEPFGPFDQIGGVWSQVSEGVLWLAGASFLSCADPATGEIRASEPGPPEPDVGQLEASGGTLYALPVAGGVVAVTPPTACFDDPGAP